jgi:hypothetical protein
MMFFNYLPVLLLNQPTLSIPAGKDNVIKAITKEMFINSIKEMA